MYCANCGKYYDAILKLKICEFCGETLSILDDIDMKQNELRMFVGDPTINWMPSNWIKRPYHKD